MTLTMTIKKLQRERRKKRTRAKAKGTVHIPRLAVFRSNKHTYLQLIDDTQGKILASVSDFKMKSRGKEAAKQIGALLGKKALTLGIARAAFDRSGYKYHGNVKAAREGAREAGLQV
ncbi:MAG: large subunit ribosomal protein L18 [Parcubacteria group bacterium Greene0714_21]|nr:MAG: large subunit ribosomal protein L18 [Parcubacteria group bacterium Greene0416_39]TSC97710.1 MAG: large subunit ribosomal protein L18 [Parcubacteria group bacterium Greene1014_47]TSD04367.1 MAG: large subunit ribosomal protein L18 [Parcubacteria group bacterium Greene0714_21]